MIYSILAVSIGSVIGGLARWALSIKFNPLLTIPMGTLLSNLIAGYVIGIAMSYYALQSSISHEWRLFIITGLCGGLSTFSSFSAEVIGFFQKGQLSLGLGTIVLHVMGSLLMTCLGVLTYHLVKN